MNAPFFAVKDAVLRDPDSPWTTTERLVAIAVADCMDENGRAHPSVALVAQRAGCCRRAAQVALSKLCGPTGVFDEKTGGSTPEGGRLASVYTLRRPAHQVHGYQRTTCAGQTSAPGAPAHVVPTTSAPGAPQVTIEVPSKACTQTSAPHAPVRSAARTVRRRNRSDITAARFEALKADPQVAAGAEAWTKLHPGSAATLGLLEAVSSALAAGYDTAKLDQALGVLAAARSRPDAFEPRSTARWLLGAKGRANLPSMVLSPRMLEGLLADSDRAAPARPAPAAGLVFEERAPVFAKLGGNQ